MTLRRVLQIRLFLIVFVIIFIRCVIIGVFVKINSGDNDNVIVQRIGIANGHPKLLKRFDFSFVFRRLHAVRRINGRIGHIASINRCPKTIANRFSVVNVDMLAEHLPA